MSVESINLNRREIVTEFYGMLPAISPFAPVGSTCFVCWLLNVEECAGWVGTVNGQEFPLCYEHAIRGVDIAK